MDSETRRAALAKAENDDRIAKQNLAKAQAVANEKAAALIALRADDDGIAEQEEQLKRTKREMDKAYKKVQAELMGAADTEE